MNNVNITGFRLIDPESWPVQQYLKKFPNSGEGKENYLYSENALVHDAVRVFAKALNDLDSLHDMNLEPMREKFDFICTNCNFIINIIMTPSLSFFFVFSYF